MSGLRDDPHAAAFEPERGRLRGIAYRMLGSVAEAEDVVQDAFLRFRAVPLTEVEEPRAFLSTTVARLCLDRLKSARARREQYVGTWLPEPVLEGAPDRPDRTLELADDLSFALLLTLERLSPLERTAFILHDVFGMEFGAVADVLGRTPAACRKLAERGRAQVSDGHARFLPEPAQESRLLAAFVQASASGDLAAITALLSEDAVLYSDGGGKRSAALNPIYGADRIARFFAGVVKKPTAKLPVAIEPQRVNQLPGCLLRFDDGDIAVVALEIAGTQIERVYIVSNPAKLHHLGAPRDPPQ